MKCSRYPKLNRTTSDMKNLKCELLLKDPRWLGECIAINTSISPMLLAHPHPGSWFHGASLSVAHRCLLLPNTHRNSPVCCFFFDSLSEQRTPLNWPQRTFKSSESQSTLLLSTALLLTMIACPLSRAHVVTTVAALPPPPPFPSRIYQI